MLKYAIVLFFLSLISLTSAQTFPEQPSPPRLVNDFSGILDENSSNQLEQALAQFAQETSTQIAIVTLNDISGYDPSDYAFRLAESWGIGQKGKSNGILILIKPKIGTEKGEAFIAVGYGLEGVVPDAVARRIVQNEMIPRFRENNYAGGLMAGVTVLTEITRGEYTADAYVERSAGAGGAVVLLIVIFIVVFIAVKGQKTQSSSIGKELPFLVLLSMLGSGSRHSGSWGSFSSGSGGGGFGGFGGGSFGGGGAGGSW